MTSGPVITVQIGYGSTWQTEPGSITWTDETNRVLQVDRVTMSRGATQARGEAVAGSCALSLRNHDRRYDPTYTAGPLHGLLRPGTPIRIRATPHDATTVSGFGDTYTNTFQDLYATVDAATGVVPVWRGTIPAWPQRYNIGNRHAWVPIVAYDGLDKLARAKVPRSVLEVELLADAPVAVWLLNEKSGTVAADLTISGIDGLYRTGSLTQAASRDGLDGINFEGSESVTVSDRRSAITHGPCVIEAVVAPKQTPTTPTVGFMYVGGSGTGIDLSALGIAYLGSSWVLSGTVIGGTNNNALSSEQPYNDALQHVAYQRPVSGSAATYIAGSANTASTATATGGDIVQPGAVIGDYASAETGAMFPFYGFMAAVAIFNYDIGATRIAAHASAALHPLQGQRTDERMTYVLDELGWPSGLRALSAGRTRLGDATFVPGDIALDYLRLVSRSEDGRLFVDAAGLLTFHDRYWPYLTASALAPQFTFTDVPGGYGYADFQLDVDDELVVNVARFTRRNGVEQVAINYASRGLHGEAEQQTTDLLHQTDNEVLSLAQWTVIVEGTPLPRVPSIRVPLHRYSAPAQQAVLSLELGQRVTVNRTPQHVGAQIHLDFLVDGISHTAGYGEWWAELFVSPVPQDTAALFLLDSSLLDGTDILAY